MKHKDTKNGICLDLYLELDMEDNRPLYNVVIDDTEKGIIEMDQAENRNIEYCDSA